MATATLTTKGQITIPKSVRDSLRLRTGDRIAFVVHGNTEATMKPITKTVEEVFGLLHRPMLPHRTVEEMDAAVAAEMRKHKR